jgi:hypothetical protein
MSEQPMGCLRIVAGKEEMVGARGFEPFYTM